MDEAAIRASPNCVLAVLADSDSHFAVATYSRCHQVGFNSLVIVGEGRCQCGGRVTPGDRRTLLTLNAQGGIKSRATHYLRLIASASAHLSS